MRQNGYINTCVKTGHKLFWQNFYQYKKFASLPHYLQKVKYTKEERLRFNEDAATYDRLALNNPTQGKLLPLIMVT